MDRLKIRAEVDDETYREIVREAVASDSSIPKVAGEVLRRAFGLDVSTADRQIIDLSPVAAGAA